MSAYALLEVAEDDINRLQKLVKKLRKENRGLKKELDALKKDNLEEEKNGNDS